MLKKGKIKTKNILNFNHKAFDEFAHAMVDAIEEGVECDSTHKITIAILKRMPGIDIDGTLEFFESLSGRCDCLSYFFVVRPYLESNGWESDHRVVPCPCGKVFNGIVNALLKTEDGLSK